MLLSISFFERALFPLYSSYHTQTYYGIILYLFLAMALCGILATVAYLFSLSSVQDSEKRSEYECGFEPFDSATRLPFDVHFYLVGILFLIFDVEIALLFPWVLGLRTSGWFGFYLMLGFIFLLAIGFLYEWKRGALIWPSRQSEQVYVPAVKNLLWAGLISAELANETATYIYAVAVLSFYLCMSFVAPLFTAVQTRTTKAAVVKGIPTLAYKNIPTEKVEKKIATVFKKLATWIKKTNAKLGAWRFKTTKDLLAALQFTETRLTLHKESINLYLEKIGVVAGLARNKHFHDEIAIKKFENKAFGFADKAIQEFKNLVKKHKMIHARLVARQSSRKLTAKTKAIVSTAVKYSALRRKAMGRFDEKGVVLVKKLSRQLTKLTRRFRGRKTAKSKYSPATMKTRNKVRKLGLLLPVALVTPVDSYPLQFIGGFLPEMTITIMIAAVLTFLAIELGQGRSKKTLALESLTALKTGLSFVIGIYFIQLCFGSAAALFNGYQIITTFTVALKLLTVVSGRFILSSSEKYVREHSRHLLEYPVVLTLAILFMLLLIGSGHLISAFLALVGFSLNLYVLVLFDATAAIAREAGIKYFYLSTVSSGLMLYSMFLIFIVLGSGHLYEIGHFLSTETELLRVSTDLLQLALIMLFGGLFFKLSAFPGHLWAAEVYEGSPDPVTAFFMLPVKVAVLAFVIQLVATAFEPLVVLWQPLILVSAAASLIWGCLAALAEPKTKRFLAYASINQIGFLLIGLASASLEGYRTTLFYLVLYAIMNIGFLVVFLHARREDGKGLLYLTDFRGFGQRYSQYSWSIAMILLSMAGIPPLAGFFGKYYLLLHAQEQELYGLVIIGLATSLVSTYYYLRLIKIMWFEGNENMPHVFCSLTWQQSLTLRLSELALWVFIIHSGSVTYCLDSVVDAIVLFNDFPVLEARQASY